MQDYGNLVKPKARIERLRARRDQYETTLAALAGDVLTDPGPQVAVSESTIRVAERRLSAEMTSLQARRTDVLNSVRERVGPAEYNSRAKELGVRRTDAIVGLQELRKRASGVSACLAEVRLYRSDMAEENGAFQRRLLL